MSDNLTVGSVFFGPSGTFKNTINDGPAPDRFTMRGAINPERSHEYVRADLFADLEAENAKLKTELADANMSLISFAAPAAAIQARDHGLPDGHLFSSHYDLLEKAGARMAAFTRATTT